MHNVLLVLLISYLKVKSLTDFTDLFSPNNFNKNDDINLNYFMTSFSKKVECNSIEAPSRHRNLNGQQFRLNKFNYCRD